MSDNLEFIKELGIGVEPESTDTESKTEDNANESENDLSLEQKNDSTGTEQKELEDSLKKQIEGMEKRISDKDDFIKTLQEQSKSKEETKVTDDTQEPEDFWDDPESKFKKMEETIRIQQMQIQETVFANTVENYWGTVDQAKLQEAVATDAEFAKDFNGSNEPYKIAYEYLTNKANKTKEQSKSLEDEIRQKILKEYGLDKKEKTEVPPNINSVGSSNTDTSKSNDSSDGFAAVFGS